MCLSTFTYQVQPLRTLHRRVWAHAERLGRGFEHLDSIQRSWTSLFLFLCDNAEDFGRSTRRILTQLDQSICLILVEAPAARPLGSAHPAALENTQVKHPVRRWLEGLDFDVTLDAEAERRSLARSITQNRAI